MECGSIHLFAKAQQAPTESVSAKRKHQGDTMDDVKDLETVTANTCPWEHEAVVRGRKLLL